VDGLRRVRLPPSRGADCSDTESGRRHPLRASGPGWACYTHPVRSRPRQLPAKQPPFDVEAFLHSSGVARTVLEYPEQTVLFAQGDSAESVIYVLRGSVKLSVVSKAGKEAVVAMLGPGDFVGEGALTGPLVRIATATTVVATTALVVEKEQMLRVLHDQHALSDRFIAYMLTRNIRVEADLVDQLFNRSEKRLARALLLLARYGKEEDPNRVLPKISQEVLAEMVGTTRSRVNFFMNKFRKLGFIEYNGGLKVNHSLLSVVLHD
jgi:CRP/FNR family cyclic AMP-dependent transcriptional regulator